MAVDDDRRRSPGYLWRPGSSPQDRPLLIVVAVVIALVVVGTALLGILAG